MAAASATNIVRTSELRAPSAFRMPISRVRSRTAVYIVLAMPRPATTRAITANVDRPSPR